MHLKLIQDRKTGTNLFFEHFVSLQVSLGLQLVLHPRSTVLNMRVSRGMGRKWQGMAKEVKKTNRRGARRGARCKVVASRGSGSKHHARGTRTISEWGIAGIDGCMLEIGHVREKSKPKEPLVFCCTQRSNFMPCPGPLCRNFHLT